MTPIKGGKNGQIKSLNPDISSEENSVEPDQPSDQDLHCLPHSLTLLIEIVQLSWLGNSGDCFCLFV